MFGKESIQTVLRRHVQKGTTKTTSKQTQIFFMSKHTYQELEKSENMYKVIADSVQNVLLGKTEKCFCRNFSRNVEICFCKLPALSVNAISFRSVEISAFLHGSKERIVSSRSARRISSPSRSLWT